MSGLGQPYARVLGLERARRARLEGAGRRLGRLVFLAGVVAALVPMVRAVFLPWLDDAALREAGLAGVTLRAGLVVLTLVGLDVHATVLRGPSRAVLSGLPVRPRDVVAAELIGVGLRAARAVAIGAVLLAPVAAALGVAVWAGVVGVLGATAALGATWSTVLLLGAIHAAESEAWAPALDAARGNNPRAQAAIIYALAPSTLVGGLLLHQAGVGVGAFAAGRPAGLMWILVIAGLGVGAWPAIGPLADGVWFRASLVLEEIRARYAAVEDPEEAHAVWMDWTLRWLPPAVATWSRLDLRHGWREWRGSLSALWLAAALAAWTAWSDDPGAPLRAALVAAAGGWWAGGVVLRMAATEATFLRLWLPVAPRVRAAARAWAAWAWSQAPAWVTAVAVLLRAGPGPAAQCLALALGVSALGAVVAAGLAGRGAHPAIYAAAAALTLGGLGAAIGAPA